MSENNNTPQTETSVESTQIPIIRMNIRAATETTQTPVDADLQTEGAAADAAATGAALALKADKTTVDGIRVNGQGFEIITGITGESGETVYTNTYNIPLYSNSIPLTGETGADSVEQAIENLRAALSGQNGATLAVNGETGATSIEAAIGAVRDDLAGKNGANLPLNGVTGASSIESAIGAVSTALAGKNGENIPIAPGSGDTISETIETLDGQVLKKEVQSLNTDEQGWVRGNLGLGDAAVKGVANNLTTETAGTSVLDAAQGYALDQRLKQIEDNFLATLFKKVTYSYEYSINANGYDNLSASDLGYSTPEGYDPVGIASVVTGSTAVGAIRWTFGNGSWALTIRNFTGNAANGSLSVTVLYMRTAAKVPET